MSDAKESIVVLVELADGKRDWISYRDFKSAYAFRDAVNARGDHAWIGMKMLDTADRAPTGRKK